MEIIDHYYSMLDEESRSFLDDSVNRIVTAKKNGGKVVVVTGSGPNIHEGVTSLIAELMDKGIVDGVTTSSAVVAHEMGGVLDKVKRIDGRSLKSLSGKELLPRGDIFELTLLNDEDLNKISAQIVLDEELISECRSAEGEIIIKAAGNMAYPMGYYCEYLSAEILGWSKACGLPFEKIVGFGADEKTMLGVGARKGIPVLVSVPQLIGGGSVGLAVGDSIPISRRCSEIAAMLGDAEVIIESAVALTQEIHDGPFETYTGHGIWASRSGYKTYSLKDKTVIRFDLDDNLKKAWEMDKSQGTVQAAVDKGLPKTKITRIPFRMEMSAFSRLENSIPVTGDIGVIWPVLASRVSEGLGINLDFISHPQQTEAGRMMREKIVDEIKPVDRSRIVEQIGEL